MRFQNCVVITGSVGCGKSTLCNILNNLGYEIVDADKISKKCAEESASDLKTAFGEEYFDGDTLNRKKLGNLIFTDKDAKKKLEGILHPKIREKIYTKIKELEAKKKLFFVDIPLYFESNGYKELRPVAVVYVPPDIQLSRVMGRDKTDTDTAKQKIASQIPIDQKVKMADFKIDNSGDIGNLKKNVQKFLEEVDIWFYKNTALAETTF